MFTKTHSRTVGSRRQSKGNFLFELVISLLMIAAILVLAFPTYQDFTPEYGMAGHGGGEAVETTQVSQPDDPMREPDTSDRQATLQESTPATEQAEGSDEDNSAS